MKKYTAPKMLINKFDVSDIITESAAALTADAKMTQALSDMNTEATYKMIWE